MLNENFRTIHDGSEIATLIQQARGDEFGQIWQTVGPLRQTYQILSLSVDRENEAVLFETQSPFDFDRSYPVYVRVAYRNVIFKLNKNYETKKNRMICSMPHEVKASELRYLERFHIPEHKNIQLILKPLETSAMEINVRLTNFSQKGMGVVISSVNQDYFQRIKTFSIQTIAGIKLGKIPAIKVKHVGDNKVGFALEEAFDKGTFTYLQNFLL